MESTGGNEKEAVKGYFNGVGFERWNRIYSETDDVNSVCFPFCHVGFAGPC
jgi:magnesium-protoporphyrin O-methyltransferase